MDLSVEVVLPNVCGAFYKGTVKGLDFTNRTAVVSFENDWQPTTTVQLSCIRYPPKDAPLAKGLECGSHVEALLPHKEGEEPGWWLGKVSKVKGELYVVEFNDGQSTYTDILEGEKLRHPNKNPSLAEMEFCTENFPVPEEIQEYCKSLDVHANFREKIGALLVSYDTTQQALTVVSGGRDPIEKASLLIDLHFKNLRTMQMLHQHNEEAQLRIQESQKQKQTPTGKYTEQFYVPQSLLGIAIGSGGTNMGAARAISGITSVELDDSTSSFVIVGDTKEAVLEARNLLEYVVETVSVPREYAGKVIGKKGNIIQNIMEKSCVLNVKVMGDDEARKRNIDTKDKVPFVFTGLKKSVSNAILMLEYHMEHLQAIEQLVESREQLDQQLRQLQIGRVPNYFPAPGRGASNRSSQYPGNRPHRSFGDNSSATNGPSQKEEKEEEEDDQSDDSSQEEPSAFSQDEQDEEEQGDEEQQDEKKQPAQAPQGNYRGYNRGRFRVRGGGARGGRGGRGQGQYNRGRGMGGFGNRSGGGYPRYRGGYQTNRFSGRQQFQPRNTDQSQAASANKSQEATDNVEQPTANNVEENAHQEVDTTATGSPKAQRPPRTRQGVPPESGDKDLVEDQPENPQNGDD